MEPDMSTRFTSVMNTLGKSLPLLKLPVKLSLGFHQVLGRLTM